MSLQLTAVPQRRVLLALCVLLALPFLAAAVSLAGSDTFPRDHDTALIELRSTDVLSSHPPLVGSYERLGGNQPAPWLFYVLAPATVVLGGLGMGLTTLLVGWLCVVGTLVVARRLGGVPLMLLSAGLLMVMVLGRDLNQLANPWEPSITLLGFALFAMLLWDYCASNQRALAAVVALGVVLAGTWVILAPVVLVCAIPAVVAAGLRIARWWRTRDDPASQHDRTELLISFGSALAVAVLLFVPLAIEQISNDPGNVTELAEIAERSTTDRAGAAEGWSALSQQLDARPVWLGADLQVGFDGTADRNSTRVPWLLLIWLGAVAATVIALWRRGGAGRPDGLRSTGAEPDRTVELVWLHSTVASVLVGIVLATALVTGGVFSWITEPGRVGGMLTVAATAWTVAVLSPSGFRNRWREALTRTAAAIVIVIVAATTIAAAGAGSGPAELRPALSELTVAAEDRVSPRDEPVLVRSDATAGTIFGAEAFGAAQLSAAIERGGVEVVVDPELENRFGAHRAQPTRARSELLLRSTPAEPEGDDWELLGSVDPLSAQQRSRRVELDRQIADRSGGAQGEKLLSMAAGDEELSGLLAESFELADQPVLYLWYRPIGTP